MPTKIAAHIREVLLELGEDPDREGLIKTPERVGKAMKDITVGYSQDPIKILNEALFTVDTDEMVIVKDIELYSLCEHHMLPFFGKAHVAYLPAGRVVGLSKLPRLVDMYSRRLQVQERLTNQIAKTIQDVVKPRGVGVVIEARHFCMMMRGVGKQNSVAVSSCMLGQFREDRATRDEFLALVRSRSNL
jgi:GTP cyclohydrolase I